MGPPKMAHSAAEEHTLVMFVVYAFFVIMVFSGFFSLIASIFKTICKCMQHKKDATQQHDEIAMNNAASIRLCLRKIEKLQQREHAANRTIEKLQQENAMLR